MYIYWINLNNKFKNIKKNISAISRIVSSAIQQQSVSIPVFSYTMVEIQRAIDQYRWWKMFNNFMHPSTTMGRAQAKRSNRMMLADGRKGLKTFLYFCKLNN